MSKIVLGPNSYILPLEHSSLVRGSTIGYAYLRCSTEMQVKELGSAEAQLEAINRYIQGKGIVLVAAYIDSAISGAIKWADRPALTSLVQKLKEGDAIIAYDVSRFGRNAADTLTFSEMVRMEKKVKVHVTTVGDITGAQKLTFLVLAGVAEQERDQISERVKNAMKLLSDKGELKCRPKFGERKTTVKRVFEPDPEKMKVVERVRELRLAEVSRCEIARRLEIEMPATDYGKKAWYVTDISRICKHYDL